jgi:hypothetical protein
MSRSRSVSRCPRPGDRGCERHRQPSTDGLADEVTVVTVTPLGDARALGAPRIAPDITTHPATAIFTQAIFGIPLSVPAKGPGAIVRIAEVSAHRAFAWGARSR